MIKLQIKSIFGKLLFEYECEENIIAKTVQKAVESSADLRSANLRSTDLDKQYIQIARIGSRKRMTTYCFEDDMIWCGCFTESLVEFEESVQETHKDNNQLLKEYMGFINYLKSLR